MGQKEDLQQKFAAEACKEWALLNTRLESLGSEGVHYRRIINDAVVSLQGHKACKEARVGMHQKHFDHPDPQVQNQFYIAMDIDSEKKQYYFNLVMVARALKEAGDDVDMAAELFSDKVYEETIGSIEYRQARAEWVNAMCAMENPWQPGMRQERLDAAQAEMFRLRPEMKKAWEGFDEEDRIERERSGEKVEDGAPAELREEFHPAAKETDQSLQNSPKPAKGIIRSIISFIKHQL